MKTIRTVTIAVLALFALQSVGNAGTNILWKRIPGLANGPWTLVSIPEGTLAVRHGTLPYGSTYGEIGPAAAFRPAEAAADTPFASLPLPSLSSSYGYRPQITAVQTGPDDTAYISGSSGIWAFNPTDLEAPWLSVWRWSWDTSDDLIVVPNPTGITLDDDVAAPDFFLAVYVRNFGRKSGYRLVQKHGTSGLDAPLTTSATEPRKLFYLDSHLAWYGVGHLVAGPAVPPLLFTSSNSWSLDGGQTTHQLPSGLYQVNKCAGRDDLWLLRDRNRSAYACDSLGVSSLNFGGVSTAMSRLADGTLVLSNENGAFEQDAVVDSMAYEELTGSTQDPFAEDSTGNPAAITWATDGIPLSPERYRVTFQFRPQLPDDLQYYIEESSDMLRWSEVAHTTGSSAAVWEGPGFVRVTMLATGHTAVTRNDYGQSHFWRLGVRTRP